MSWQNFLIPSSKELLSFENNDFLLEDISRFYHFQYGSARLFIDLNKRTGKYVVKVYGRFDGWHFRPEIYCEGIFSKAFITKLLTSSKLKVVRGKDTVLPQILCLQFVPYRVFHLGLSTSRYVLFRQLKRTPD